MSNLSIVSDASIEPVVPLTEQSVQPVTPLNSAERPVAGMVIPYDRDFDIMDGKIYFKNPRHLERIYVCQEVHLVAVHRDLECDDVYFRLKFAYKGQEQEYICPRAECLSVRGLLKFAAKGLDVTEQAASYLINYLRREENMILNNQIRCSHSHVGADWCNAKPIFKLKRAYGIQSDYSGILELKTEGTLEQWLSTYEQYVKGNTALEAMLAVGFSSALIGFAADKYSKESLIAHLSGSSSTGKTIVAQLALSIWCNPNLRVPNGLAHTWNSTINAMLKELDGNHGLPVLFDEIGMSEANNFRGLLYMLGAGVEKARLDRTGGFRDRGMWATTIIMTGEFSPLKKSEKYEGLQVRLLEFADVSWTTNGNQADAIKRGILSNCGHAGPKFVEYILPRISEILSEIEAKEQELKAMLKAKGLTSNLVERRAWHLAVLMETVHCVNESALKLDLNEEAILQFLLDQEMRANRESDLGETSYQYFKEQVLSNWNHFLKKGMGKDQDRFRCPSEIWGRIDRIRDGSFEVNVFPENFERIMHRGGFTSIRSILTKWKDNQGLSCETDRTTRKRKLIPNGLQLPVYVVKFNDADEIIPPSVPIEDAVTASGVETRDNER